MARPRMPDHLLKRPRRTAPAKARARAVPSSPYTHNGFVLPLRCDFDVPESLAEAITWRGQYRANVATLEAAEARKSETLRAAILEDRRQCLECLDVAIGGVDGNAYVKAAAALARVRLRLAHYQAKVQKMESEYVR